jgi:hypothetical protein
MTVKITWTLSRPESPARTAAGRDSSPATPPARRSGASRRTTRSRRSRARSRSRSGSTKTPPRPERVSVTAGDGANSLNWKSSSNADTVVVTRSREARPRPSSAAAARASRTRRSRTAPSTSTGSSCTTRPATPRRPSPSLPCRRSSCCKGCRTSRASPPRRSCAGGRPRATYYHVQLRGGRRILAAWPAGPELALPPAWSRRGRRYRLTPGTYRWYVWAGVGSDLQGSTSACGRPRSGSSPARRRNGALLRAPPRRGRAAEDTGHGAGSDSLGIRVSPCNPLGGCRFPHGDSSRSRRPP